MTTKLELTGTVRRSEAGGARRTVGGFGRLVTENQEAFRAHFGCNIFPGSLNIDVPHPETLQAELDKGTYRPAINIPREELQGMPDYIGDGQAWKASLGGEKISPPADCWVFRRIGSRVPQGVIEILAPMSLSELYDLRDGDPVDLTIEYSK